MIVPAVFLENAALEVPVSAHKRVGSWTHLCELRMFSSMVVFFLPHSYALLLKFTLLFKNFLLRALLLLLHHLKTILKKNLMKAEETKF